VDQRDNKRVRGEKRDVLYCYFGDKAVLFQDQIRRCNSIKKTRAIPRTSTQTVR